MSSSGEPAPIRADGHWCRVRGPGARVNGVRIDPVTRQDFVSAVEGYLACPQNHVLHFCAAHPTVDARRNPAYRDLLNQGDLNVADGRPVAWAGRLFGQPTDRLTGTDGFHIIARWGLDRGLRHFLYGGDQTTLDLLRRRLEETYPGIKIVGTESPPFSPLSDEELEASAYSMREARAQALWVGLGTPKQDLVGERLRELRAAPMILCVGAAFDFIAGTKRRAPVWMQRTGLEWVHRLVSEPRRLWRRYLLGNPAFVAGVLADRLRYGP